MIQSAAALEYPAERLQIQVVDDPNDGRTSAIIDRTVADVRREPPAIDVTVFMVTGCSWIAGAFLRERSKVSA